MSEEEKEDKNTFLGMNIFEYVLGSKLCIGDFDRVLTATYEKTQSTEIYLLREIYRKNFNDLGIYKKHFKEMEEFDDNND